MAITGALLMGATILAGVPGYTAKASDTLRTTEMNKVVYEGDTLKTPRAVYYIKPGMSGEVQTAIINAFLNEENEADMIKWLLHESVDKDVYFSEATSTELTDYSMPAPKAGSNCWIITILMTMNPDEAHPQYYYFIEPYTASAENGPSDNAAPVYVYVEPAWLTTWKGMLTGIDKQIADAKAGDTVILDLGEYYNISNARMQQIAEKNDVTFVLNITYDKVSYSLTIEPGTEIDLSCDWYGPLKLLSMFPYEVVE